MKKMYEAPAIEIQNIETVYMIAESGPDKYDNDTDGISKDEDVLSRDYDWDD